MKTNRLLACCLLFCCLLCCLAAAPSPAQDGEQKQKSEQFTATAYLPTGAGRRMVGAGRTANVNLYVESYSTDEETQVLARKLLDGGPDAVLKELEQTKPKGKITLTGHVGFYDLKFIRSRPTAAGRRVSAVTDRPIGFLEAFNAGRSQDYNFGIVILDLKTNKKGKEEGEGQMIYAAKVKVIDGNKLEIENFGVDPVRLMSVRKF
jgi:hypothetical protein